AVALAVGWYAYLYSLADRRLRDALAEADRLDPGWRMPELEASRALLPDSENAAVHVLAASTLQPAGWPYWDRGPVGQESPQEMEKRQALAESLNNLEPAVLLNDDQVKALRVELTRAADAVKEARKVADFPRGRYAVAWRRDFISTLLPHAQNARN